MDVKRPDPQVMTAHNRSCITPLLPGACGGTHHLQQSGTWYQLQSNNVKGLQNNVLKKLSINVLKGFNINFMKN